MNWKKNRNTASVWLTGAMLVGLLAGCAQDGQGNAGGQASSNQKESNAINEEKEPVAIEYLAYDTYGEPDPNSDIVKAVEEKFNAKFDFWFVDSQKWNEVLNTKFAAGEMPDLLQIKTAIPKYVENGILEPIEEETIREFAPTYAKMLDEYPDSWNTVKYDGKLYGIPRININGAYPFMIVWNKKWLDKVGLTEIPDTIQEVEGAFTKFRNEDPDGNGKKDTYGLSDYGLPAILGAFGSPGITEFKNALSGNPQMRYMLQDGKVAFAAIQPEMKEALALLQDWYKKGFIDPEFITSENTGGYWADSHAFNNGRIGFTSGGMFYHWNNKDNPLTEEKELGGTSYQSFIKAQPKGEVAFGSAIEGPGGAAGTPSWGTNAPSVGLTTEGAKNPRILETYLKMIEANATDWEYSQLVSMGEKGVCWDEKDGKVYQIKCTENGAEFTEKGMRVFALLENPEFIKRRDEFGFQFADEFAPDKSYAPLALPSIDDSQHANNLTKLTVEYYVKIITGEYSVDQFDEYVKKFNANGGDKLIATMNEEYSKMIGK